MLFIISRFISGLALGSNETLVLIYNKEMSPDAISEISEKSNL